jgi:hypothetical protein
METMRNFVEQPCTYCWSEEDAWDFLLEDGRLIGLSNCNHYELLGIASGTADPGAVKKAFCVENRAVRICFSDKISGHLNVEIHTELPNEAQWSALGTLYRRRDDTVVVWDLWSSEDEQWKHGEGSLGEFK